MKVTFTRAAFLPPGPTGPVLVSIEGELTVYPLADVSPKAPDHPGGIVNVADLLMVRNQLGEGGGCN